ncbi:DNA primase [subsurface metagenome]
MRINKEKEVYYCDVCGFGGHLYKPADLKSSKKPKPQKTEGMKEEAKKYSNNLKDELLIFLKEVRGLKPEIIQKYKIGFAQTHPKYSGKERLTIPILKDGKVINIRFHSLKNEEPKDYPYDSNLPYATYLFPEDQLKNSEIWLCEGELDALCAISHGLPAISVTGGANSWKEEFTPLFKGKIVNIVYDNDEAGRKGADRIERILLDSKLCRAVNNIKIDIHKDITDWFVTYGKTAEELKELRPKKISDIVMTFRDFRKIKLPEKRIILNPWIKEQLIILISGWRGVGKTWLALSLLDAITRGKKFGPWQVENPVPCLYLDGEMAGSDILNRHAELNPNLEDIKPFYIYSEYLANFNKIPQANLSDKKWQIQVKEILLEKGIKLWVIDNISSVTPGIKENEKESWDPINRWLIELRFAGITTILIHHTGKEGLQRGTSAREDNIDVSINLKRPPGYVSEEGAKFIINFTKTRMAFEELSTIADIELELTRDEKGKLIWVWGAVKKKLKDKILEMFDQGMKNQEIADALGKAKGFISREKYRAIKNKLLTEKNKLTEQGKIYLFGEEKNQ